MHSPRKDDNSTNDCNCRFHTDMVTNFTQSQSQYGKKDLLLLPFYHVINFSPSTFELLIS